MRSLCSKGLHSRLDVVVQEIGIMEVQLANLQQLRDAVISIWTKIARSYLMQCLMASRSSLFWAFYTEVYKPR